MSISILMGVAVLAQRWKTGGGGSALEIAASTVCVAFWFLMILFSGLLLVIRGSKDEMEQPPWNACPSPGARREDPMGITFWDDRSRPGN
jgi:hypothetical protein